MSFDADPVAGAVGEVGPVASGGDYVASGDVDRCCCVVLAEDGEGGDLCVKDEGPDFELFFDARGGTSWFGEEGWEEGSADVGGVAVEMSSVVC